MYSNMYFVYCALSIYLSTTVGVASGYCYDTDPDPYRLYTTETRYDELRAAKNSSDHNTSTIEGCEPSVFYFVARHGSRYANEDTIRTMSEVLPQFQETIASEDTMPCPEDLDAIAAWVMRMNESDGLMLAPTGWQEMRDIASRFSTKFPALLNQTYDSSLFEFLHTESTRTRDSARAFAEGLFGSYDGVDIQELPQDGDWLLYFYENCQKYMDSIPEKMKMYNSFRSGPEMEAVFSRISNRTGLSIDNAETVDLLHDSCSFEYQVYNDAPWCAAFVKEELEVYEYAEDVQYHWTDGYGDSLNYEQTCELLKDIVHYLRLDNEQPEQQVLTRFAHSGAIFMLYARLGLFYDGYNLTDTGYETSKDRLWRSSLINSMSGNIAFVRYNCTGEEEDKIAVYENEQLITLPVPGCTDGICPVSALRDAWLPITTTCDVHEICAVVTSSAYKFTFSLAAVFLIVLTTVF